MQSETGFPSSHQFKSYVASKSCLKLAARCPVSGCWPSCFVVDVDTVCLFKARLDKFWMHQDDLYDFTADLIGIGEQISMRIKLIVVLDIQK